MRPIVTRHSAFTAALLYLTSSLALFAQSPAVKTTPVPTATGPILATADSYPYDAAAQSQTPIDLAQRGYVEEEYFVSGTANVYDWAADGSVNVKASGQPYSTRILVRKPSNPARFSGTVIVEAAHSARGYDFDPMWGFSWEYFLAHGDAYVAVTVNASSIGALKMFDMKRYVNLSYPRPMPDVCAAGPRAAGPGGPRGAGGGAPGGGGPPARPAAAAAGGGAPGRPPQFFPEAEDGVKWDVMSQVGALLKSKSPSNPLANFNVQALIGTAQTADDWHTYSRAFHKTGVLEGGKPVYDGYLIKEGGGPGAVNRCGGQIAQDDPRRQFRNVGVPVVFVVTQNYVPRLSSIRREDSDQAGDQFRLYEIPGASHLNQFPYRYMPVAKDQAITGSPALGMEWPYNYECDQHEPMSDFPEIYLVNAMFYNLDQWIRKGTPPPRAPRIELTNPGTPRASFIDDSNGNATGGLRTPFVDAAAAKYVPSMTGANRQCGDIGYKVPFSMGKMEALYGNYQNYESKVLSGVDRLVQDRWLLPPDAEKLKSEVRAAGK